MLDRRSSFACLKHLSLSPERLKENPASKKQMGSTNWRHSGWREDGKDSTCPNPPQVRNTPFSFSHHFHHTSLASFPWHTKLIPKVESSKLLSDQDGFCWAKLTEGKRTQRTEQWWEGKNPCPEKNKPRKELEAPFPAVSSKALSQLAGLRIKAGYLARFNTHALKTHHRQLMVLHRWRWIIVF